MATSWPRTDDARPFGIDLSRFNPVDWCTVNNFAAPPVTFCMIRWGQAHKGAYDDIDRRFFYNWANAKEFIGWPIMGYHVIYPGSPIPPQVENVKRIGQLVGNDWGRPPFWIDLELHHNQTGAAIIDKTYDMLLRLQDLTGIQVGIYTGKWFIDKYRLPVRPWWAEIPWWLAQYGAGNNEPPLGTALAIPNGIPVERALFHQTTSNLEGCLFGAPLGTRVDGNRALAP